MTANILGSDGLIVLIVAVVVLFGGSQLPKLAKNFGSAGHEFRKAQREAEAEHAAAEAQSAAIAAAAAPAAQIPVTVPQMIVPATDERLVVSRSELRQELSRLMEERERPTVG
jgi:sec-independent protein translocase protein TatA